MSCTLECILVCDRLRESCSPLWTILHFRVCMCACLVLDGREEVEREDEGAAKEDGDGGEEGADEEHHDCRADQSHEARVP